jgi:Protein of unknown function (DUF3800)
MVNATCDAIEHVFVDESGSADLPGADETPDFYVICGILLPAQDLNNSQQTAQGIVRKHAGLGLLKSSSIGANSERRSRVLEDIGKENFPFYCLLVDKTRVWKDSGLQWKSVFYKFLHRMFYARIKGVFVGINVVADKYGQSHFMESFKKYIEDRSSLFDRFDFRTSQDVPLLQIADVIAGTIRRVYLKEDSVEILEPLGYPSVPIEEWPPTLTPLAPRTAGPHEYDGLVLQLALDAAKKFVEAQIDSENETSRLQAETIRYLLYRLYLNPEEYVYRAEITDHLHERTGTKLNETTFSTTVLAIARDHGVLLASTERGVKIPSRTHDLQEWVTRANAQVVPYLERIEDARNRILLATGNQYDIVDPHTFPDLSKYFRKV